MPIDDNGMVEGKRMNAAATDAKAATDRLDDVVERWFFDSFHGSVVARSTEVWNHVHGAKDELKRRLAGSLAHAATD